VIRGYECNHVAQEHILVGCPEAKQSEDRRELRCIMEVRIRTRLEEEAGGALMDDCCAKKVVSCKRNSSEGSDRCPG
jgi:hypothetical protein